MREESMDSEEHIEQIYNILDERGKILEANQKNIEVLITTLQGNSEYGTEGYKQRIAKNEANIDNLDGRVGDAEERFTTIYQRVIGICVGVSILLSVIGWFITNDVVQIKGAPEKQEQKRQTSKAENLPEIKYKNSNFAEYEQN